MISQKSIQEVIDTARIEDVVEDFVSLKRRGSNMIGLCPFHAEKTPSFSVSPSKNIFKCFGCGKGGGPIQFIIEHEQMTFPEAIRYLAKKYNITLEEDERTEEMDAELAMREQLFLINEASLKFFTDQLYKTDLGKSVALSYLTDRGFSKATIDKFGLGYAPPDGHALIDHLKRSGYNEDYISDLGLITKNKNDFFRDRVMFTLHNVSGKIVGFAGRSLKTDKRVPKYMNSPESPVYQKSKFLYGTFFAKGAIRKEGECILVEGYTDVISLHEAGIENVVASSGTALTEDQIRLIKRYTDRILILYDSDPAGIKAAMRGIDLILEQDLDVRIALLPEGEDPDSFVQRTGEKVFRDYLAENARDFVLFKTDLLYSEVKHDPIRKASAIKEIVGSIARIPDQIKQSLFIQECSRIMDISESILITETNKQIKGLLKQKSIQRDRKIRREHIDDAPLPHIDNKSGETESGEIYKSDQHQEKDLLRILLMHGNKPMPEEEKMLIADAILNIVKPLLNAFDHPVYAKVFKTILEERDAGKPLNTDVLANHQDPEIAQTVSTLISSPYEYSANWEDRWRIFLLQKPPEHNEKEDLNQGLFRFQLRKFNKVLEQQRKVISGIDSKDNDELNVQLEVYQRLLDQRNKLARELQMTIW